MQDDPRKPIEYMHGRDHVTLNIGPFDFNATNGPLLHFLPKYHGALNKNLDARCFSGHRTSSCNLGDISKNHQAEKFRFFSGGGENNL